MHNNAIQTLLTPFDYRDFSELNDYWLYYDGMFSSDVRSGSGLIKLSNGEEYEGAFSDDQIDGPGKFSREDGQTVEGVWKANRLQKQF